ncbi:hypothetical protein HYV88_06195 [Candidatus Woesearchaeota archaeon]|nr:hypothetical protein [Candidatus Woesearchaeota archaeon]
MLGYLVRSIFEAIRTSPSLQQRTQEERDNVQRYLDSDSFRRFTANLDEPFTNFSSRNLYKGRYERNS